MIYAVVMAGGSGTRFWPKSTKSTPKQFLNLFGQRTLIQKTVDRLNGFIPRQRSMIVTNQQYVEKVTEQLPEIPQTFIIGEAVARNTGPCIAAAAQILANQDPEAVMVVLPADHHIQDEEAFREVLSSAAEIAKEEEALVTIGIQPDRPETGYGYIRFERESENARSSGYQVLEFTEKPDQNRAASFIESGDYLWNSGMFIWKAATILKAFETYQPDIYKQLEILEGEVTSSDIDRFYHACPSISVDYGIMEQADQVRVLPGDFGWNDVGSWKAVYDLSDKEEGGNTVQAAASFLHQSEGNLIHSESNKIISLVGVRNLAVVETDDAILVCDLDQSQEVRKVVEHLREDEKLSDYL